MELKIQSHEHYLEIVAVGPFDSDYVRNKLSTVILMCCQLKIFKVLIDFRLVTGEILETDKILIGLSAVKSYKRESPPYIEKKFSLGFLAGSGYCTSHTPGADVMKNGGMNVLVTVDEALARDWLKSVDEF